MSGTLAPSQEQSSVQFLGLDKTTNQPLTQFTKTVSKKEYVAGGRFSDDVNVILRKSSDILTTKFGDEIVDKMLRDPEIKKCETVIKISVLGEGVTFFPAVSKPAPLKPLTQGVVETEELKQERLTRELEIQRYDLAVQYANFVTRAIENLDSPFRTILENMLDAITYGNKVAEQTYKEIYDDDFKRTLLTLDSIRVKSRRSTKFVVNKFNKIVGFQSPFTNGGAKVGDDEIILPREKFMVLTFRGKDGDPRGTSILECVYNAWYLKMQLWPEYLRWLLQCALPSLVGITSETSDQKKYLINAETGEPLKDLQGNPLYESDVDTLLAALEGLRNSSAIALPHGADVKPINNSVSGDPFKGLRDVLNEEIEMGMILQTLATSEGRHMSRAASESHMGILDVFIAFVKGIVLDMITNDLIRPLMNINFANFDVSLLPKVSLGDSERRNWSADVTAIAALWKSGFMGESQKVGYDMVISAPERDIGSDHQAVHDAALMQASVTASAKPNPNGAVPSGEVKPNSVIKNNATPNSANPSKVKVMEDFAIDDTQLDGVIK